MIKIYNLITFTEVLSFNFFLLLPNFIFQVENVISAFWGLIISQIMLTRSLVIDIGDSVKSRISSFIRRGQKS